MIEEYEKSMMNLLELEAQKVQELNEIRHKLNATIAKGRELLEEMLQRFEEVRIAAARSAEGKTAVRDTAAENVAGGYKRPEVAEAERARRGNGNINHAF